MVSWKVYQVHDETFFGICVFGCWCCTLRASMMCARVCDTDFSVLKNSLSQIYNWNDIIILTGRNRYNNSIDIVDRVLDCVVQRRSGNEIAFESSPLVHIARCSYLIKGVVTSLILSISHSTTFQLETIVGCAHIFTRIYDCYAYYHHHFHKNRIFFLTFCIKKILYLDNCLFWGRENNVFAYNVYLFNFSCGNHEEFKKINWGYNNLHYFNEIRRLWKYNPILLIFAAWHSHKRMYGPIRIPLWGSGPWMTWLCVCLFVNVKCAPKCKRINQ